MSQVDKSSTSLKQFGIYVVHMQSAVIFCKRNGIKCFHECVRACVPASTIFMKATATQWHPSSSPCGMLSALCREKQQMADALSLYAKFNHGDS